MLHNSRALFCALLVGVFSLVSQANAQLADKPFFDSFTTSGPNKVMLFGGLASDQEFAGLIQARNGGDFNDIKFVGAAFSKEFFRYGGFSSDFEIGAGYQNGDGKLNDTGEFWSALYFRYDAFPWNHIVKTSVAGSVGVDYFTRRTEFENLATSTSDKTQKLLHYFSPEISFSLPDAPNQELVFRLHHRSSVFGLFGCRGCGSNVATIGLRHRF